MFLTIYLQNHSNEILTAAWLTMSYLPKAHKFCFEKVVAVQLNIEIEFETNDLDKE